MEMKRLSKHSQIILLRLEDFKSVGTTGKDKNIQIIIDDKFALVEYIPCDKIELYLMEDTKGLTPTDKETPFDAQPQKTQQQKDLETALDTQLINDPLGRYNGCNLREPFDRGDVDWIEWVLKNMHNKFIRDKVALIKASNYGNINN